MADQAIDISKGMYPALDGMSVADSGYATSLINFVIDDSGANVSRPGYTEFVDLGNSPVDGLRGIDNSMVAVTQDRKIYSVTRAKVSAAIQDTVLEGVARPVFAKDGTYLAIAGGLAPKRWNGTDATTEDMPGTPDDCSHIVYHKGYWLQNTTSDSQRVNFAGPTSALRDTWDTSNDFFSAENSPDGISSLGVLLDEVYAVGSESYEKFQNVGDAVTPYVPSFGYNGSGILAPYSLVAADNRFWYLSSEKRFVKLEGVTPVQVNTPFDKTIRDIEIVTDCFGFKFDIGGHYLIVWKFPNAGKTYVHDYKNGHWYEWDGFSYGSSVALDFNSYEFMNVWEKHLVGSATDGKIYDVGFGYHTDNGSVRRCLRRQVVRHGTGRRKRSNGYILTLKRGQTASGSTEPVLEMRVKDDGGEWSEPQQVGLGLYGDTEVDVRVDGLRGIYRQREIEIKMTDAVGLTIKNPIIEDVQLLRN